LIKLRFFKFVLVRKSWPTTFQADHAGSIPVGRSSVNPSFRIHDRAVARSPSDDYGVIPA
jgi:hypothetical protein